MSPALSDRAPPEEHVRFGLAIWAELLDRYFDEPDPLILYTQSWLEEEAPATSRTTRFKKSAIWRC